MVHRLPGTRLLDSIAGLAADPSSRATTVQVVPVWSQELASCISSRCPRRAHRSVGHSQDSAAGALCNLVFPAKQAAKPRRAAFLCRHEGPVCAIPREQIRHDLASSRNCRLAVIGDIARPSKGYTLYHPVSGLAMRSTATTPITSLCTAARSSSELLGAPRGLQHRQAAGSDRPLGSARIRRGRTARTAAPSISRRSRAEFCTT